MGNYEHPQHIDIIKWREKNSVKSDISLTKTRTNPVRMSPWSSEVVSKTEKLPSPAVKKEIQILYYYPGFPWVPLGKSRRSTQGEANGKCIRVDAQEVSFFPLLRWQFTPIKRVFLGIRYNSITSQTESPWQNSFKNMLTNLCLYYLNKQIRQNEHPHLRGWPARDGMSVLVMKIGLYFLER